MARRSTALPKEHRRGRPVPSASHGVSASRTLSKQAAARKAKRVSKPAQALEATTIKQLRHDFTSNTISTDSVAKNISAASPKRAYLLIQNVGSVTVYLGFGTVPNTDGNGSIEVPAGSQLDFSNGIVPDGDIAAVSLSPGKLAILEGTSKQ